MWNEDAAVGSTRSQPVATGPRGHPILAGTEERRPDPRRHPGRAESAAYSIRVDRLRRFPWVTTTMCGLALALHAMSALDRPEGASAVQDQLRLLDSGAKSVALVVEAGEVWRLLTSHLVHTSWLHILFNLAFLLPVAGSLEQVVRRSDFAAMLLASATISGLASLLWTPEVSAGASGLVFATLAAAVAFGIRHRHHMGPAVRHHFGLWVLPFLALILAIGLDNPYVDQASHLGGMAAGAALGPLLRPRRAQPAAVGRPVALTGLVTTATLLLAPTLARGGAADVTYTLPDGGHITVPPTWSPRFGALGSLEFQGASGLVILGVERVPTHHRADVEGWYRRQRLAPLAAAGLIDDLTPGIGSGPPGRIHRLRYRLTRGGAAMVRDLHLVRGGDGTLRVVSLETPAAWSRKYAETRARVLGSLEPPHPAASPSHTRTAAAIP